MASAAAGLVVTTGALVLTSDLVNGGWQTQKEVKRAVATVVGAIVAVGLDKAVPGLGTGLGVILVLTAAIKVGPPLLNKMFPGSA